MIQAWLIVAPVLTAVGCWTLVLMMEGIHNGLTRAFQVFFGLLAVAYGWVVISEMLSAYAIWSPQEDALVRTVIFRTLSVLAISQLMWVIHRRPRD